MRICLTVCRAPNPTKNSRRWWLPVGPYSQAVVVEDTLFAAGQVGLDPQRAQLVAGGAAAETRRALENQRAVLEAAGFTLRDVVQVQVFLTDMADYAAMNEVYAGFFPAPPPARTTVQVAALEALVVHDFVVPLLGHAPPQSRRCPGPGPGSGPRPA